MTSKIGWTDETWNIVTGCNKVSPGCRNCYALHMSHRLSHNPKVGEKYKGTTEKTGKEPQWTGHVQRHYDELFKPLSWKKPRRIFVCSMSDLFHPDVPYQFIEKVFTVMAACPQHQFQILTKRPRRMRETLTGKAIKLMIQIFFSDYQEKGLISSEKSYPGWPLRNVWFGTSVEDQERAIERIPELVETPAAVRFLSCEPLLGKVVLDNHKQYIMQLDWVIAGGESGSNARPVHPRWVRSLMKQTRQNNVPFFFKQWGSWIPFEQVQDKQTQTSGEYCQIPGEDKTGFFKVGKKAASNLLDGQKHEEFPDTQDLTPDT